MCERLTDQLHRGNRALAEEHIQVRCVVELVLPEELPTRLLREWNFTHEGRRSVCLRTGRRTGGRWATGSGQGEVAWEGHSGGGQ